MKKNSGKQAAHEFQSLGRLFRVAPTPVPQVILVEPYDIENRIAARLAQRLASENLPLLVITDETIHHKKGA